MYKSAGVIPNTDFLKDSYISLNVQGFVEVNQVGQIMQL